jgi:phosphoserine aminotransferase
MNVPFTIPASADLEKAFIKEAEKEGMVRHLPLSLLLCSLCAAWLQQPMSLMQRICLCC